MVEYPVAQVFAFKTNTNPVFIVLLAAVVAAVILLRLYNNWAEKQKPVASKKNMTKSHADPRKTDQVYSNRSVEGADKKDLKYVIKTYAFNKDQSDFFTRLCNGSHVRNPSKLLQNQKEFDDFCARTFKFLEAQPITNKNTEKYKTLLFTIRECVENYKRASKKITSTRAIGVGQQFTLTTDKDEQYPSSVLENTPEGLLCAVPRDIFGNELRLPLWSRIKIFFYSSSGDSYTLVTKVRRFESARNSTTMRIAHTDTITPMPNRNHARKTISTPCSFNPVTVANIVTGKHTEHKFFPSPKTFTGTLLDLSAGGCSIKSPTPVADGEYLQIKFMLDAINEEIIIAKNVKHHADEGEGETIMHIQFAKIPRASMNRIFSFIYNYGEHSN